MRAPTADSSSAMSLRNLAVLLLHPLLNGDLPQRIEHDLSIIKVANNGQVPSACPCW